MHPAYVVLSVHPRVKLLSRHDGWDAHGRAFTAYRRAEPSAALLRLEPSRPMAFGWGERQGLTVLAAILGPESWEQWLTGTPDQALALFQTYPAGRMEVRPAA
jgi:hypothetical protein